MWRLALLNRWKGAVVNIPILSSHSITTAWWQKGIYKRLSRTEEDPWSAKEERSLGSNFQSFILFNVPKMSTANRLCVCFKSMKTMNICNISKPKCYSFLFVPQNQKLLWWLQRDSVWTKSIAQNRNFTHREVQLQKSSLSLRDKQEKNPDFPGSRAKH